MIILVLYNSYLEVKGQQNNKKQHKSLNDNTKQNYPNTGVFCDRGEKKGLSGLQPNKYRAFLKYQNNVTQVSFYLIYFCILIKITAVKMIVLRGMNW